MNILVTGISSGFGKGILELKDKNFNIVGITSNIKKSKNTFYYDEFKELPLPEIIILNAAIGDSGDHFNGLDSGEFYEILNINLIKPISYLASLKNNNKLVNLQQLIIVGSRFSSLSYIDSCDWEELPGYGYCLSKTALSLFCKILRKENPSFFVNIIHPGILNTQLGNPNGHDCAKTAKELLFQIKNKTFMQNHNGIYDLQDHKLISF